MSIPMIIGEMLREYEAGLACWSGNDPIARKHFKRVIELGEKQEIYIHHYYFAHSRLIEIYDFVLENSKADYYRKRLKEVTKEDK